MAYIDKEKLVEKIVNTPTKPYEYNKHYADGSVTRQNEIIDYINEMPVAEEKVKHSKWVDNQNDVLNGNAHIRKECLECGDVPEYSEGRNAYKLSRYCRNCGARMDGAK